MKSVLLVVFALSFLAGSVLPQDQSTKLRLAQSYEQAGDHENAVKLYEELHARDPGNFVYFEGLRRTYLQLKRYDEATTLIQRRLAANPDDVNLRGLLGSVMYKAGREQEAYAEWDRAIAAEPSNPNVYRAVANVLLENRLLDRTAELYRKARIACNDPNLFIIDLAQLLSVSMDYAGATQEYIRWLKQNPTQIGFVQGRMAAFTGKEEGRSAAIAVVRENLRRDDDLGLHRLLGWLYLEGKQFMEALTVFRTIDAKAKSQGAEIYGFAERAYKERAFDVAASAYLEAINTPVGPQRMPFARYGYASALKEVTALADTMQPEAAQQFPVAESRSRYGSVIQQFRRVIEDYPRTEFAARSYHQIGLIQFERLFDLDGALSSFEQVERELPGSTVIHHAVSLGIGEVHIVRGDTARAAARFLAVAAAPNATPDQQDEATYRLAELEYFAGNFRKAVELLGSITLNLKADYANDALSLLAFLQENVATDETALKEFARADFLARQRKNTQAIPVFQSVIQRYPKALLVDEALMKVASLQAQARLFTDAIASYERLLQEFKESSIALDRAQFNMAEVYQFGVKNRGRAIQAYEQLLVDFPQSLLVTSARKRIRELRGDTL